ncbi:MAG TPA: enolase C-terminal domain-like protein [Kofleriaceae bacterium]|nr:enolase C-terminal domain-like protein [Kofleriaceae bacterium]
MKIVGVDARVVRWPIEARGAARGVWHDRAALIVGVHGDGGETGLGEAAPLPGVSIDELADAAAAVEALAARAPFAIETPAHATGIADRVTAAPAARFAIESALLAAIAQHTRISVAAMWSKLPLGELAAAIVVDDEHEAARAVARGARCLKIKADTPERVHRIARAAPHARLRVDANRRWPRADVWDYLASLADLAIDFVEEPCADAIDLLGERLPCRIALDETLATIDRAVLDRAVTSPDLAALVLKPTIVGGFARSFDLAALAHAHGVAPIVSHALEGPIGFAACTELARAIACDLPVGLGPHPALEQFWSHA